MVLKNRRKNFLPPGRQRIAQALGHSGSLSRLPQTWVPKKVTMQAEGLFACAHTCGLPDPPSPRVRNLERAGVASSLPPPLGYSRQASRQKRISITLEPDAESGTYQDWKPWGFDWEVLVGKRLSKYLILGNVKWIVLTKYKRRHLKQYIGSLHHMKLWSTLNSHLMGLSSFSLIYSFIYLFIHSKDINWLAAMGQALC